MLEDLFARQSRVAGWVVFRRKVCKRNNISSFKSHPAAVWIKLFAYHHTTVMHEGAMHHALCTLNCWRLSVWSVCCQNNVFIYWSFPALNTRNEGHYLFLYQFLAMKVVQWTWFFFWPHLLPALFQLDGTVSKSHSQLFCWLCFSEMLGLISLNCVAVCFLML